MNALRRVWQGAAALTLLEGFTVALLLALLPYLMRTLGPAGFGRYAMGVAAAGACAAVVDWGFPQLGAKLIARAAGRDARSAAQYWSIQSARGAVALALTVCLLAALAGGLADGRPELAWGLLTGALGSVPATPWCLQGLNRYRTQALALAFARLLAAAGTLALVHAESDAAVAVALQAGAAPLAGLLAWLDPQVRQALRWRRPDTRRLGRTIRRRLLEGAPLFVSNLSFSLYTTAVPLVLGAVSTPAAVGLFSAADKARIALQTLLQPVATASLPTLTQLLRSDREAGLRAVWRIARFQLGLATGAAVLVMLLAHPMLALMAGPGFAQATPVAQVLGWCLVCTALTNALGVQLMVPLDLERCFARRLAAASLLGVALTALLGHHGEALGAALGVLATELLIAVLIVDALRRRGIRPWRAGMRQGG